MLAEGRGAAVPPQAHTTCKAPEKAATAKPFPYVRDHLQHARPRSTSTSSPAPAGGSWRRAKRTEPEGSGIAELRRTLEEQGRTCTMKLLRKKKAKLTRDARELDDGYIESVNPKDHVQDLDREAYPGEGDL